MPSDAIDVRPTKRCLGDLEVELPDLGTPLSEIDDPVVVSAKTVPEQRDAGGVERVVSLTDRVWFKVLPIDWDWKRLSAEQAVAWRREMKRMVIGLIAISLKSGHPAVAEFRKHRIKALVRASNGHEAYLAIIAEGVPDPEVFALLLDCVPGIAADDWQPEPSPLAELNPASGEIIWSTLLPSEVASRILDLDDK